MCSSAPELLDGCRAGRESHAECSEASSQSWHCSLGLSYMAIVLDFQYVGGADAEDGTDSGLLLVDELSQKRPFGSEAAQSSPLLSNDS